MLYTFCVIATWISSYCWYYNQVLGNMNKCSVYKDPHFIFNRLILFKVPCFDVKLSWRSCFKGISLLSDLCLARNLDDLLDEITGLFGISLLIEPDDSTYNVSNESYEEEDSDEIIIVLCAIRTCYSSLIASLWRNMFSNSSLALFIIFITSKTCECWFLSGWNWRSREQ